LVLFSQKASCGVTRSEYVVTWVAQLAVTSATLPKDASKFVTVNPRKDASIAVANTLDALILDRVQVDATAI
jgi:hypothetical protein